jgi:type I restriction enzyme S subunit
VAALKRIRANLKRYRASVLKAACEGRLVPTEAELARRDGLSYETGGQLLARILKERRARWETDQLAKMQAAGKIPKDDKWKAKYPQPSTPSTSELPELPHGWAWVVTGQIANIQGGIQKQPKRTPKNNAFPFLRVANVLRGSLELSEIHHIELFREELRKLRLEVGDLLIVEGNGSASEIGRMATWNGAIKDCVHQNHIIRARLLGGVLPGFVTAYWNSREGASRVLAEASSTSGLYTLSVAKVGHLPVPLPPLSEQRRIVSEAERRLSTIDELSAIVDTNLKRADRLRQSIRARAFEGKLVPQYPNDEPVTALLEGIRAEKAFVKSPAGGKERKRPQAGRKHVDDAEDEDRMSSTDNRRSLLEVLKQAGGQLNPEQLFEQAGHTPDSVESFYEELRSEIAVGRIVQERPNRSEVVLRVAAV